jgi:hypothetical protein
VHEHNHPSVPEKPVLRRIVTDDGTTYFLDALTQQIYTQDYQRVGWMDDGKIILLEET